MPKPQQPKLNPRQRRFAQEYIVDLNGTQAAIRAGYSEKTAGQIAERLLKKVELQAAIQDAIAKRERRIEISQDRILLELSRVAFGDLRDVVQWNNHSVVLRESASLSDDAAAALAEVTETASGALKVKRHDKVKALELLMRHKGMLNDKLALNLPTESLGVAACEQRAIAARERLLVLRGGREAGATGPDFTPHEDPHEQDIDQR